MYQGQFFTEYRVPVNKVVFTESGYQVLSSGLSISEVHNLFGPGAAAYYFLVHLRAEDKIMIWTFENQVPKPKKQNLFN